MLKLLPSPASPQCSIRAPHYFPVGCRSDSDAHPHSFLEQQPHDLESEEIATNAQLAQAVQRQLRSTGHESLRDVEIEVQHATVILWGRVPSYYLKQLAQSLTQRVPGVRLVANGLEVVCSRRRT